MRRQAPCRDCPNKGCGEYHSQCKEYIEYSELVKAERKQEFDAKTVNELLSRRHMGKHRVAKTHKKWRVHDN